MVLQSATEGEEDEPLHQLQPVRIPLARTLHRCTVPHPDTTLVGLLHGPLCSPLPEPHETVETPVRITSLVQRRRLSALPRPPTRLKSQQLHGCGRGSGGSCCSLRLRRLTPSTVCSHRPECKVRRRLTHSIPSKRNQSQLSPGQAMKPPPPPHPTHFHKQIKPMKCFVRV